MPDKLPPSGNALEDDPSLINGISGEVPTCGWLLEQVEKKYAQLIKELKSST